jgi:nucleolin
MCVIDGVRQGNPKIFVQNVHKAADDALFKRFFKECGEIVQTYWLTDRKTKAFRGSGFITFDSPQAATAAVKKSGQMLLGKAIEISIARPMKSWKGAMHSGVDAPRRRAKGEKRELSERPEGCTTCFVGNLSWQIDEERMVKFAGGEKSCKAVRFLSHQDTGKFKGCAFVEFHTSADVDWFVTRNGDNLMGRVVQIDYAAARADGDKKETTKGSDDVDAEAAVEEDGGWGCEGEEDGGLDAAW